MLIYPTQPPAEAALLTEHQKAAEIQVIDHAEVTAHRDTRFFGLVGGLTALSALAGNRFVVETPAHITPLNLQILAAAPTGAGKEQARKIARGASEIGRVPFMREPASASGLHSTLLRVPSCVIAVDEFGQYLRSANEAKGHDYQMLTLLMEAFTSADATLPARHYANSKDSKEAVAHPYTVGLFTTTALELLEGLGSTSAGNGFLGRMLVLMLDEVPPLRDLDDITSSNDDAIKDAMQRLADWSLPEGSGFKDERVWRGIGRRNFWKLPLTPEARDYYVGVRRIFDENLQSDPIEPVRPLWARALETATRIAGCVALGNVAWRGDAFEEAEVDLASLQYAVRLVVFSIKRFAPEVEMFAAESETAKLNKRILRAVERFADKDGWALRRDIYRGSCGRGATSGQINAEIDAMLDPDMHGTLRMRMDAGKPARPAQLGLAEVADAETASVRQIRNFVVPRGF